MTFEKNLFRVLHVSIYDSKATINERADELSFENPVREEIFNEARFYHLTTAGRKFIVLIRA